MNNLCAVLILTLIILSLTLIYYYYQKNRYESKVQELFLKHGITCNNILASTSQGIIFDAKIDRKSTRLNSSHVSESRMPSSA